MKLSILLPCFLLAISSLAQKNASISFEKWISLKSSNAPVISPDGKTIVYTVSSTDWANNAYDAELWMSREGETPIQLTRTTKGSSGGARFTPDSRFVSFMADRGEKTQLYLISVLGGEAMQVTKDDDGIGNYDWSPAGDRIAYTKADPESKKDKTVKERYGGFGVEGEEYRQTHLWLVNFHLDSIILAGQVPCYGKKDSVSSDSSGKWKDCVSLPVARRLTEGNFNVGGFAWRPDGKSIAFNRQTNPLINSGNSSDIVLIDVATRKMTTLISNPSGDFFQRWSPDGKAFVYGSSLTDSTTNYFKNNHSFIYDMDSRSSLPIGEDIDENKFIADWSRQGLFLGALEKTKQKIIHH
jgi:Tol biopolymer transport system component